MKGALVAFVVGALGFVFLFIVAFIFMFVVVPMLTALFTLGNSDPNLSQSSVSHVETRY